MRNGTNNNHLAVDINRIIVGQYCRKCLYFYIKKGNISIVYAKIKGI